MALEWEAVKTQHVREACERLAPKWARSQMPGLVVHFGDKWLPAKQVLKVAYRIAHGLADGVEVKFSSGDTMLNRLNRLGFLAERHS